MKLFGKWKNEPAKVQKEEMPFDANAAPDAAAPSDCANRTILVVDDNPVVLKAFQLKLKSFGFNVLTASEGATAVSIARQDRPDIMVLDINFPPDVGSSGLQWDGFNIMQWLRRFQEAADIPVIIITGGDPEKFKERALAAGAAAFFHKPINNEEFVQAIREILSHRPVKTPATPAPAVA